MIKGSTLSRKEVSFLCQSLIFGSYSCSSSIGSIIQKVPGKDEGLFVNISVG